MGRRQINEPLGIFSKLTGEIKPGEITIASGKQHNPFKGRFNKMSSAGSARIGKSKVRGRSVKLLMIMISYMRERNVIEVRQSDLAKEMGIYQPDVSACIRELIEDGILRNGDRKGVYLIDPRIVCNGGPDEHQGALDNWILETKKRFDYSLAITQRSKV